MNTLSADALPFVSVVTPTWNRRAFLPYLLHMFQYQDYPAHRRELVILDDSEQSSADLVEALIKFAPHPELIRYYHQSERLTIGQKRNRLHELAQGEYLVCMDDDDFYRPDKLTYTINAMIKNRAIFAACDAIPIWYSHVDRIFMSPTRSKKHVLNGTFAYHRNFLRNHRYNDADTINEEFCFTRGYTAPVLQLDPWRSIICVSHNSNTFDKDFVIRNCVAVNTTLEEQVDDAFLMQHYRRLSHAPLTNKPHWNYFQRIVIHGDSQHPARAAAFQQQLVDMGASVQQIELHFTQGDRQQTASHLALARRAKAQGWSNYLLLDDRLQWVRQEKTINSLNQLLRALPALPWDGFLLASHLHSGHLIASLPGAVKVEKCELFQLAYCVNGSHLDAFITCLDHGLHNDDQIAWRLLLRTFCWFNLYPSMFYLAQDRHGADQTALFFSKLAKVEAKAVNAGEKQS